MKYVLIFALFVAIAQIDTLVKLFDKAKNEVSRQSTRISSPAETANIRSSAEIVSVDEDVTLKIDPHTKIIALMESYRLTPEPAIREKIMEDIKVVPKMLTTTIDRDLETVLYSWRDLVLNQNEDTIVFMLALDNLLQGDNQYVVRRILSSLLDQDLDAFIKIYGKTKDVNCKGSTYFIDTIPPEERLNELRERDEALDAYLKKENLETTLKNYATLCQLNIKAAMTAITSPPAPTTPVAPVAPATDQAPATTPVPPQTTP